jgi:hypothetical protein
MRTRRLGAVLGVVVAAVTLLMGVVAPVAPAGAAQGAGGLTVSTASSTVVVRPGTAYSGPSGVSLQVARNEFESFQVVLQAGGAAVDGITVAGDPAAPLTGPGGQIPWSNATFSRADTFTAVVQSDSEGGTGAWSDALVPESDAIYGQNRAAFPLSVPANENRVAWVDLLVPLGTAAGTYNGTVRVTATGGVNLAVPVQVEVLNVDLPSTSSLDNAFYTNWGQVCLAHTGSAGCNFDEEQRWALHSMYERLALENRVTIANPWKFGNNNAPSTVAGNEKTWFEQYIVPLISGTSPVNDAGTWRPLRLPGAEMTVVSQYGYNGGHCLQACWDTWKTAAAAHGFTDKMVLYGCDEPNAAAALWASCRTNYQQGLTAWPTVPNLVTSTLNQLTTFGQPGEVDILVPPVNRLDDKSGPETGNRRATYDTWLAGAAGRQLWSYTSCLSEGCVPDPRTDDPTSTDPYWNGWPGYAIDAPAVQARAMGMMSYKYQLSGELFWETTHRLAQAWNSCNAFDLNDPNNSNCQYYAGGNGDGTLFYPGLGDANPACPNVANRACIGGTDDIPLESIRLKRIRDGREDYEYLKFLTDHGKGAEARAIVDGLFPTMHDATANKDGATFDNARAALIALIKQVVPVTPPPGPAAIAFTSDRTGNNDIFVMDANGNGQTNRTMNPANDQFPAWSPTADKLAFTSNRAGTNDIWVMNGDGTSPVRVSTGAAADTADDQKPAWSPDGTKIAFVSNRNGNADIFVVPATGGTTTPVVVNPGDDIDPAFTRDGASIVFSSYRGATGADLYSVPATGGAPVALTGGVANDDDTPDTANVSNKVAFDRVVGASYDVFTMNADGTAQTNLTSAVAAHDVQPSFSPDDTALAFVSLRSDADATTDWEIYTMSATGTGVVALTRNTARDADPDWKATPVAPPPVSSAETYSPINPTRVLDSRDGTGGYATAWGAGQTRTVTVAGGTTGVPAGADAVVLNLTGVFPSAATHLTVWPTGSARPVASNLNLAPGQVRPNLVTVKVGSAGTVSVFNNAGTVHVLADVVGYYDDDGGLDGRFTGIVPQRVLDSRDGTGGLTRWGAGQTQYLSMGTAVPSGATAVALNVTATGPSAATHITVWSSDEVRPTASNLNLAAGETAANLVVAELGTGGVALFNNAGSTDLIVDVVGYFAATPNGEFTAMVPRRVLDSRDGTGGFATPWGPLAQRNVVVAGGSTGVPADASAVVLNLTGVFPTAATHLTVWPAGGPKPTASNLNLPAGDVRPNLVVVNVGPGGLAAIANQSGSIDVLADIVGYYR